MHTFKIKFSSTLYENNPKIQMFNTIFSVNLFSKPHNLKYSENEA